jgi:acyl carrier protein
LSARDPIEEHVDRILVEEFEVEPSKLTRTAVLAKDLDLDSLDGVDLDVALEKTFRFRIPEGEVKQIRTLEDIYVQVRRALEAAPAR